MDPEDKQQSDNFGKKSKEKLQSAGEKAQKAKTAFKIFMKLPTPVKIAIIAVPIGILLLILFFAGSAWLLGLLDFENIFNAKKNAMDGLGGDSGTYSSEVIKLENGKWNLNISDAIKTKITDAGIDISGKSQEEILIEYLKLNGLSVEDLSDEEINLLPYLIKAEIATQQLDLRSESDMYKSNGKYIEPDTSDMENNSEVCGTIHLKRVNSKDMSTIPLSYVDYETFKSYANNKDEAIKHFSFNDGGNVVIYTWNHINYSYEHQKGEIDVPDSAKKEDKDEMNLQETTINDYKSLVNKYTLPFEVLTALLINSEDVKFTKKIADLAFKANIEISLIEEYEYTKTVNTTNYYQTIRGYQHLDGHIKLNGESVFENERFNSKL